MAGHVYAAVSHKGGAGRSTASANIAYQAANAGHSVCLVDLDLDSATLGSVLGLRNQGVGAAQGIQTLLDVDRARAAEVPLDEMLIDLSRAKFREPLVFNGANRGSFYLLPGNAEQRDLVEEADMVPILVGTLSYLAKNFELVIIDVRAGKSGVMRALLAAGVELPSFRWLLFYRWTHQHLAAAQDMIETLQTASETGYGRKFEIVPIATARIPLTELSGAWFEQQYHDLSTKEDREIQMRLGRRVREIPFDPVFQWKEQILLPNANQANAKTREAFKELAANLVDGNA